MENNKIKEKSDKFEKTKQIALGIVLFVLITFVLKAASAVTVPLAVSFFLFLILNPLVNRLEKNRVPRWLAISLVITLLIFMFALVFLFLTVAINSFINKVPKYINKFEEIFGGISDQITPYLGLSPSDVFADLVDWKSMLINTLTSASGSVVNILSTSFLIFIFVLFLLLERQSLIPKFKVALPSRSGMKAAIVFERINRQISQYLILKSLISLGTGILFYVGALAVNLDFAVIWGVLAFLMNFIPSIGSVIITVLTIIMATIQFFPDYVQIIYVALIMTMIQMIMGNILDPRFQGSRLNLSPFVILVALIFWGYVWGIVGMFLSVPIMAVTQIVCDNIPGLKPISVLISSGKRYRKQIREEDRRRREKYRKEREEKRRMNKERRLQAKIERQKRKNA
ncbi:MAG: AI-2E family transporter [Spirochaetia bacterium]|nr:AI-2E family transporter [Spirochaetia bacterium]